MPLASNAPAMPDNVSPNPPPDTYGLPVSFNNTSVPLEIISILAFATRVV